MPLPFIPIITAVAAKGAAVAGTVLASKAAIGVGAAIAAGAVAAIVVKITRDIIREKARERAKDLGYNPDRQDLKAKIKKCWKSGSFNKVDIGIYDDNQNELGEFEIDGDEISADIRAGMVIEL